MSSTPPASAPPPASQPTPPVATPPPASQPTPPVATSPPTVTPTPSPPSASTPPPSVPPPVPASTPPPAPASASAPPPVPASVPPPVPASSPPPVPASSPPPVPASTPPPVPSPPAPATPSTPPPTTPPSAPSPTTPPSTPSPPSGSPPSTPSPTTPSTPTPRTPSSPTTPGATPSTPTPRTPSSPTTPGGSPPATRSPPSPPSSSPSTSTALIAGVAVGGVVILLLLVIVFLCCRKKRRERPAPTEYYGGPSLPSSQKDDYYGGQGQSWQLNAPPMDHAVNIPPSYSPPPAYASRPPVPPPPPPVFSSSGGSGSNYSGSENPLPPPSPGMVLGFSKSTFTFEELVLATDGFSDANLLGQGGFGYVHRGILSNGKEVAIKQLKAGSGQGEREFQAEVEIISRVHHKHLVSLVGYCITGDKRLLVYEFVPNNTLEFHLHGKGRPTMAWSTRLKIALGSAKGLAYLHEDCHPKIIHRDIKAANILLDFKFEPKVADFGLAKFTSDNNTHVSTRVMGTFGYLAPEYATSGKLSDKSDVFSFGVMLLELITGQRPVNSTNTYMDDSLVDWARPVLARALEESTYDALADPRLQMRYDNNEMARMVACAAACVRHSAKRRPRMSQIVRALEGDGSLDDLHEGVIPGHSSAYGSYGGSDYDSGQYNEDMKKFRKLALTSQEYASSEYSAPTSEYGQNPSVSSNEAVTREMETGKMNKDSVTFR